MRFCASCDAGITVSSSEIQGIARRIRLSRNTVGKYLRAESLGPWFQRPERPNTIDPYADKLAAMLRVESSARPTKTAREKSRNSIPT